MSLLVGAAILVAAALLVALLARAVVSRRKAPPPPPQQQLEQKPELPKIEVPEGAAPAERVAREQRPREDLGESQASLHSPREPLRSAPQSAAARAAPHRH